VEWVLLFLALEKRDAKVVFWLKEGSISRGVGLAFFSSGKERWKSCETITFEFQSKKMKLYIRQAVGWVLVFF